MGKNKEQTSGFDQLKKNNKSFDLQILNYVLPILAIFIVTPLDLLFNIIGLSSTGYYFYRERKNLTFAIQLILNVFSLVFNLFIIWVTYLL